MGRGVEGGGYLAAEGPVLEDRGAVIGQKDLRSYLSGVTHTLPLSPIPPRGRGLLQLIPSHNYILYSNRYKTFLLYGG